MGSDEITPRAFRAPSAAEAEALDAYREARARIDEGLIRPEQSLRKPERSMAKWRARMAEMRSFLEACGEPQRAFPAVHVTGTSGKGSVSTVVAEALRLSGYRVGLHTSPFLQAPTEKVWVDGELISPLGFADLVDWVWPIALPRKTADNPASIHGMASVALAFEAFRRAEVDVAVIEAGCGGRFDLTSFLDPAVTVVTTVGMDHALSLGPEVTDIAWHKAGILRPGVPAVTGATGAPLDVIRREAAALDAPLAEVTLPDGPFWEMNGAVAAAALEALRPRFDVPDEAIDRARRTARLPARREAVPEPGAEVLLDGAHNPDKMAALGRTLADPCVVVMGCLEAKDHGGLVDAIRPFAAEVVATEPHVYAKPSTPAADLASACRSRGIEAAAEPDPIRAVEAAVAAARGRRPVVVTGSLYLVGEVRERWYPTDQVVLQRTSWPEPAS